jgi:hypothetical protein
VIQSKLPRWPERPIADIPALMAYHDEEPTPLNSPNGRLAGAALVILSAVCMGLLLALAYFWAIDLIRLIRG